MKFRSVIELGGKTATGFEVPDEVLAGLASGKRPAVRVTIRGYAYRTTVGAMGGRAMIPLSAEHRSGAGVAAGEEVEVEVELDTEARELTVPEDFRAALAEAPEADRYFQGLSYSNKRRFVLQVDEAKSAETRRRRIEKFVGMLKEGRIQ